MSETAVYRVTEHLPVFSNQPGKPSYVQIPTHFFYLMQVGQGIPASFWKMTFVVWKGVVAPRKTPGGWEPNFIFKTTTQQWSDEFGVKKAAVSDWTHAYDVSGLFDIELGKLDDRTPTVWFYKKDSTQADWTAFVSALSKCEKRRLDRSRNRPNFKLSLLNEVNIERERRGLPEVRRDFLEQMAHAGHAYFKDGAITWKEFANGGFYEWKEARR